MYGQIENSTLAAAKAERAEFVKTFFVRLFSRKQGSYSHI